MEGTHQENIQGRRNPTIQGSGKETIITMEGTGMQIGMEEERGTVIGKGGEREITQEQGLVRLQGPVRDLQVVIEAGGVHGLQIMWHSHIKVSILASLDYVWEKI